ncbi:MAG: hypothetical protein NC247_01980 [Ruminococcus flavefaciens]|nr:hypothetical protein [Ruminococcus flavefaciens]
MGHYDEQYDEMHKEEYERELEAKSAKFNLMHANTELMTIILFQSYLDTLNDKQIIDLYNKFKHLMPL